MKPFAFLTGSFLLGYFLLFPVYGVSAASPDKRPEQIFAHAPRKWQLRLAEKILTKHIARFKNPPFPEGRILSIAAQDSNCLHIFFKNGQAVYAQNVRISNLDLYANDCNNYKAPQKRYNLIEVESVQTTNRQIIFSSRPRNHTKARLEVQKLAQDTQGQKIILGNGEVIRAIHVKVMENEVIFTMFDGPGTSEICISKWYVHTIIDGAGKSTEYNSNLATYVRTPLGSKSKATWAFIVSLCGGLLGIPGIPLSIVGIVLGIISMRRIKSSSQPNKGRALAISAILLGVSFFLIYVIAAILLSN
jgi:hypothetical protein